MTEGSMQLVILKTLLAWVPANEKDYAKTIMENIEGKDKLKEVDEKILNDILSKLS